MKIYIDVSMIMIGTKFTGIPRVVMELVKRFSKEEKIEVVPVEYDVKKDKYRIIDSAKFAEFCSTKSGNRNKLRTNDLIAFDEFEEGSIFFDSDTVWKTRVKRSFLYPVLKEKRVNIVPFIHDIIPIEFPEFCGMDDVINFVDFTGAVLNYSDRILVSTNTTKNSIEALAESLKTTAPEIDIVTFGGEFKKFLSNKKDTSNAGDENETANVSDVVKEIAEAGKYLIMVGTIEPRKNHKVLLDAYENMLKDDINLVIAGYVGQGMEDLISRIENNPNNRKGLWRIESANDEEIDYLYRHAYALSFSSYAEGFGLPLIEAMVRRVPIIASDTPINHEVAGDKAVYFGKDDWKELGDTVLHLLKNEDEYKALVEKTKDYIPPTWEDTADGVIRVFENVCSGK